MLNNLQWKIILGIISQRKNKIHLLQLRQLDFFGGGEARSSKGGLLRGSSVGVQAAEPPGRGEVFKNVQKAIQNLQFFENFTGNFSIFSKFFKILSNFSRKVEKRFR